jgi:hypothetical protein
VRAIHLVILLSCAAGVAPAAAPRERWIGYQPARSHVIERPEAGRFPFAPGVFPTSQDTLFYDDNIATTAWAWPDTGSGWGVKFTAPGDSVALAGALVYFYGLQWPPPGGNSAAVRVFAADGPNGAPGTLVWANESLTIVRGAWNWVPVGETLPGNAFYVFYFQSGIFPYCPGVCTDAGANAGDGRQWQYTPAGGFALDERRGDWLIRPVLDWTPQAVNATASHFWVAPPRDTDPGISLPVTVAVRSLGDSALPAGTPVRLRITGPRGYAFSADTTLDRSLGRGELRAVRLPSWPVPDTAGTYVITTWVEAAGEAWPADDTLHREIGVSQWIDYANFTPSMYWLHWADERAVRFDPVDFGLAYPVGLTRLRAVFASNGPAWRDSSFRFRVYAEDGATVLYESDTLEALPGQPGPAVVCDLESLLVINSGEFWVSVRAVDTSGLPGSVADDSAQGRSFYKDSSDWQPLAEGEYLFSASVQDEVGIEEEPGRRSALRARLSVSPNPARGRAQVAWTLDRAAPHRVALVDAAGRVVTQLWRGTGQGGSVSLDARGLAAGCYFVLVEGAGSAARQAVVVAR